MYKEVISGLFFAFTSCLNLWLRSLLWGRVFVLAGIFDDVSDLHFGPASALKPIWHARIPLSPLGYKNSLALQTWLSFHFITWPELPSVLADSIQHNPTSWKHTSSTNKFHSQCNTSLDMMLMRPHTGVTVCLRKDRSRMTRCQLNSAAI